MPVQKNLAVFDEPEEAVLSSVAGSNIVANGARSSFQHANVCTF